MTLWLSLIILAILFGCFIAWFIFAIIISKTAKEFVETFDLSRHALSAWILIPFFYALYLVSRILPVFVKINGSWKIEVGKIDIKVHSSLPWGEGFIVVPNHPMDGTEDTFFIPIIIFFLRPKNFSNPIRYFPTSMADKINFADSPFFRIFVGSGYVLSINRLWEKYKEGVKSARISLEKTKKNLSEIILVNPERGRTLKAILSGRYEERITPEGKLYLGKLKLGAAELAIQTKRPLVPVWSRLVGDNSYSKVFEGSYKPSKVSPARVLLGLLKILLDPRKKIYVDISRPEGPIRREAVKKSQENSDLRPEIALKIDLTKEIQNALFKVGELQLKRLSQKSKK